MKDQFGMPIVPSSFEVKKLVDFLVKESDGHHTEFRIVVRNDGTAYAHVMDRDSTTVDFKLKVNS